MNSYTKEELIDAQKVILSIIKNCEKIHPKFAEGTSQHTLLKNRIKAMYISEALIKEDDIKEKYTLDDLTKALPPVTSIISKSKKAQEKFEEGTGHYTRLNKMIKAMYISKSFITSEIEKRG
ncbi:hypothetical protein [Clostridium sp.]|uniref:hypothetical protein n=1 Tax=Clostridium sp. TaxID=1506 RepID=UPI003F38C335